ncbi:hypothetical protein [Rathayibacter sp. AY1H3]|uniref:hypothetical protein n=1 Tax=Rathayibacter sp. AY1H3 TaxID=2080567 RepID=UPI000CE80A58|nr:hypothetical protein [Rathayibacter sp. AY1H3]PPH09682.1 hypothetical protein C5C33_01960 [Rathayibacter sp. AY1H3]PPH09695.1 hypothetical protein C5C33_02035 [Rathayibacter sp. AY1H3]
MTLSDVLAIIGLVGGVVGFLFALSARKTADKSERVANDARADAAAAQRRSADSNDRIAAAVEQMAARSSEPDVDFVRVFEDALNARVEWAIEERAEPHSYRLRNTGNVGAEDVQIRAIPAEHAALLDGGDLGNIDAGQVGLFKTSPRLSLSPHRVAVSWIEGDTRQPMRAELNLP